MGLLDNLDEVVSDESPWTLLEVHFSLNFPGGQEPDPALVRQVRVFDPNFVPLNLRKAYRDPQGQVVVFNYHCIGRWADVADDEGRDPIKLERPSRKSLLFPFEGGVVYDQRTVCDEWAEGSKERRLMCPEVYLPFDARLVRWMEAAHRRLMREIGGIKQKVLDSIDQQTAAEQRAIDTVEDDARRSLRSDRNMIRRAIDEGQLSDPPPDPQPYVQAETVYEGESHG